MIHAKVRDFAPASGRQLGVDLHLSNARSFIALLEAFRPTGGTAPGEVVGRLLEEHQGGNAVSLATLICTGQVFGFEWRAGLWIPMFQFDADNLALKVGAQRVRAELPPLWSGWRIASWFAGPNARLDGRSPADMLACDLEAVVWAARSLESVDALAQWRHGADVRTLQPAIVARVRA
jgi:hypothetical protein